MFFGFGFFLRKGQDKNVMSNVYDHHFSFSSSSIQAVSCHAVPGVRPALELTLSASPAYTTLQQPHLYQTFTFHCPPLSSATNPTPGEEDCFSDSWASHFHLRNGPVLTQRAQACIWVPARASPPGCSSVP